MELNKSMFIGKVKGQPTISEANGKKSAQLVLTVNDRTPGANGQWVSRPMDVLIYTQDTKRANVIEQYVKPEQELLIEASYINWKDNNGAIQHAFRLISIGLGYAPKSSAPAPQQGGFPPGM